VTNQHQSFPSPGPPLGIFTIEIAAPTARTIAARRGIGGYGESSSEWRPFPQQKLSMAEYARQVVERWKYKAEVSEIKTVDDPRTRRPGIILIDPWFVADETGRFTLEAAVRDLPRWVLPLLILGQPGDTRTLELADNVRDIFHAARALRTESSRRGARGASSLESFFSIIGKLVAEAERLYIRDRKERLSSPSSDRTSPGRHPQPDVSAADPLGEAPDA